MLFGKIINVGEKNSAKDQNEATPEKIQIFDNLFYLPNTIICPFLSDIWPNLYQNSTTNSISIFYTFNMSKYTVSASHSLKIMPINKISRFARLGSRIKMVALSSAIDVKAIPGSIAMTATEEDGIITKKITFSRSNISADDIDTLERYTVMRLIAFYTDERGSERVCGSPDYPLTFSYTLNGGIIECTLTGKDTKSDAFI
jgi:hypothetical protein